MAVVIQRVDLSEDYRVWLKAALNEGRGKLLSLSPGGAYVASDVSLLPQAELRVKIVFPGTKRFFEVGAVVNWENRGAKRRGPFPPGYGLRFTDLDSHAVEAIRDILKSATVPKMMASPDRLPTPRRSPSADDLNQTVPLSRETLLPSKGRK